MIQVLVGDKGAGKTKRMISLANDTVNRTKGHLVYVSDNSEGIFELDSKIRLDDVSAFPISSAESLNGFIYGIISQDYDIETIFIDSLSNILNNNSIDIAQFLKYANKLGLKENINFVFGLNCIKDEYSQFGAEYIAV